MNWLPRIAVLVLAICVVSCGGHGGISAIGANTRKASLLIKVKWPAKTRLIPLATANLVVAISGTQGPITSVTIPSGQVTTTVGALPAGNLTIAASAVDTNGSTLAAGSQPVTTQLGPTPQSVAIDMTSDITSLVLGPSNLLVTKGWTQPLNVSGLNAQGQMCLVTLANVKWSVVSQSGGDIIRPTIPSGVVTGDNVGTAVIRATDSESQATGTLQIGCVLPGLANSAWPKIHHDAQNTGRGVGSAPGGVVIWSTTANGVVYGPPALALDGTIYASVGSYYGNTPAAIMAAFDPQSGAQKWQFGQGVYTGHAPAVASDGTVYVGCDDGNLYALQGQTGLMRWKFATNGAVSAPTIGPDGTIYVGSTDTFLYAINGADGSLKWKFNAGGKMNDCPAIGPDGTIYVGSYDHSVYAVDGSSGTFKWKAKTGDAVEMAPSVAVDGTVFVGSDDNTLYVYDGQTGALKWSKTALASITGTPVLGSDGTVYAGSANSTFFALDGQTGTVKWQEETGGGPYFSSPVIGADDNIYVIASSSIDCLNGQTGAVIWQLPSFFIFSATTPAMGPDGTLYYGAAGSLFAVR